MYFPVPRLTTSPATMIISICSSEMKRPPTQNWLKNCDFWKILKIASKTVTFERSLKLAQRLWLLNIPKWTWVMMKDCSKSCVLFPGRGLCLVLYAQLKDYVWSKLLWLLHACFDLIICDFANGVSNVTYQCRRSFLSRFVMSPKHLLVPLHFVPPHACFFLLFKSQLKTKISANQKLDQLKLCPQCPMCSLLSTMKSLQGLTISFWDIASANKFVGRFLAHDREKDTFAQSAKIIWHHNVLFQHITCRTAHSKKINILVLIKNLYYDIVFQDKPTLTIYYEESNFFDIVQNIPI